MYIALLRTREVEHTYTHEVDMIMDVSHGKNNLDCDFFPDVHVVGYVDA